jgi:chaperonin cofactor prefoldin
MNNENQHDLESRVTSLEIRMAVAESNIKEFGKKLDKIDQNLSKVMWILIVAVIGAVLNLVLRGGV